MSMLKKAYWCNIVLLEKHLALFLHSSPQSSAVFKIQHTFDPHAWCIFSAPLNRKRQCILKNLGEMLQIKNRVGKTNTHTHTNACLHPALLSRRLLSRCCCEFLFALNTDIPPVPHAAAHCSNSRPVDQCSLNLRAWIIIEALASIDWSAEGQLQYERSIETSLTLTNTCKKPLGVGGFKCQEQVWCGGDLTGLYIWFAQFFLMFFLIRRRSKVLWSRQII